MKKVDVLWQDGTTREVPLDSRIRQKCGRLVYAAEGGWRRTSSAEPDKSVWPWNAERDEVGAARLVETSEPPVKVDAPNRLGALVGYKTDPDEHCCFPLYLSREGWITAHGYKTGDWAARDAIADGAVVLFEGVALND